MPLKILTENGEQKNDNPNEFNQFTGYSLTALGKRPTVNHQRHHLPGVIYRNDCCFPAGCSGSDRGTDLD
jgi:hypothetical protein